MLGQDEGGRWRWRTDFGNGHVCLLCFRETVERAALLELPVPPDPLVPLDPLDPPESLVNAEIL